jgi:hypothetical protein
VICREQKPECLRFIEMEDAPMLLLLHANAAENDECRLLWAQPLIIHLF